MADPYAALKAKYGVGEAAGGEDPYADLKAKYGVEAQVPAAAPVAASVPGLDMGPAARRARAGMAPGPRSLTAEESGTDTGPVTAKNEIHHKLGPGYYSEQQAPERAALGPGDEVTVKSRHPGTGEGVLGAFGTPQTLTVGAPQGEMTDPLVQMGTAYAMGRTAGAPFAALPRVGAVASQAVEGGTINKASGGDFTTGAALAAGPAALAKGARAAKGAVMEGAPARVAARIEKNLAEDARKPVADAIERKAEALTAVIDRNPELRKVLSVSKEKPAKALAAVEKTSTSANAALDDDFAKMREHYADKPNSAQASVPQLLDDYDKVLAANKGDLDKTRAIRNARKALVEEFGADGVITPDELRSLKRSIGRAAFPPGDLTAAKVKAQVGRDLYRPIARQMQTLAKNTPDLDVQRFMNLNEDVSTLIPVQEALRDKVKRLNEGKKTFGERVAGAAHTAGALGGLAVGAAMHSAPAALAVPVGLGAAKLGGRIARGIDYRLAESQLKNEALGRQLAPISINTLPLSYGSAAAEQTKDRGYAGTVLDSIKNGKTLQEAVAEAGQ